MLALGLLLALSTSQAIIVPDCFNSHGMENGKIPDNAITASSFRKWYEPYRGRLNNVKKPKDQATWCTDDLSYGQWFQVDLGKKVLTTKIATQGRPNSTYPKFVASYMVGYSDNGVNFTMYKTRLNDVEFSGNQNNDDIALNLFADPIAARYIRVYPVKHIGQQICMRLDLYGCDGADCSVGNGGCSHKCYQASDLVVKCDCPVGYELDQLKNCTNIDECATSTSHCNQICKDTEGSYDCSCFTGYRLTSNKKTCIDIDECIEKSHNCSQRCINIPGKYECRCHTGYRDIGGGKCEDIDECTETNHGCSDSCANNDGSYKCTCPTGYKIGQDQKTCEDIDECTTSANCDHNCIDTDGSFICTCNAGYRLNQDGHTCDNINECVESTPCDLKSTNCIDTTPGYVCSCKTGYEPTSAPTTCKRVICNALTAASGTLVTPPRCLSSDSNYYQDVCTFSCSPGFEPADANNMAVRCEANKGWSNTLPYCKRTTCPAVPVIANGLVSPASCFTSGSSYGHKCHFSCNNGYKLFGPSSIECQSDKSYLPKGSTTCRLDVPAPWITCPSSINAVLSVGQKTAKVTNEWQEPTSDVQAISIRPSYINKDYAFPAGETKVTFVATNSVGVESTCDIFVTIKDREAPEIKCPSTQFVTTILDKVTVTWPEPVATDNVGVTTMTSVNVNGAELTPGTYSVSYIAKDAAGNSGSCGFYVYVKKKECRAEELLGLASCNINCQTGNWFFCTATANATRAFATDPGPWGAFASCTAGEWSPPALPDCVLFKVLDTATGCPDGTTQGAGADANKCLNCPIGKYFDTVNKNCVDCPVDTYQPNEASLSCLACPSDTTTANKIGARSKDDCNEKCKIGEFSSSGYHDLTSPCQLCPLNHYQDEVGSTICKKCPEQYITRNNGSSEAADCGLPATISYFHPNGNATATEKLTTSFICKSEGEPSAVIEWKKVTPTPDGFGGAVKLTKLYNSQGTLLGIKYTISGVTEHDAGYFQCSVANAYGSESRQLYLKVELDYSR